MHSIHVRVFCVRVTVLKAAEGDLPYFCWCVYMQANCLITARLTSLAGY